MVQDRAATLAATAVLHFFLRQMTPIDPNRIQPLSRLEFFAREVVEGFITGLHKSPYHGFSVEFAEHRLYNAGESTRNIDWKLFGRTEKLFVKRFEEETNLRCQLVIDNSASMYYPLHPRPDIDHPTKLLFAVYASAALLFLFKNQRDAVGLSVFGADLNQTLQARSNAVHIQYLFSLLESLADAPPLPRPHQSSIAETLHLIAESVHKRSLVVIFSDMLDKADDPAPVFQALQHLRHNKHEVILFHVTDKASELDFAFDNRPYRFVDVETGQEIKLNASEVRERYVAHMKSFMEEMKARCAQYRIDLVEADIQGGFDQILLPYLLKRARLY